MSITVVKFRNLTSGSEEMEEDSMISVWLEVDEYFKSKEVIFGEHRLQVSIDSQSIRDKLHILKPENREVYLKKYYRDREDKIFSTNHPFSSELNIEIFNEPSTEQWDEYIFLKQFLEQLFLAMNVSGRGTCNYATFSIGKIESQALYCSIIESAWHFSDKDRWPNLRTIPFAKTWKWMEKNNFLTYILADTPVTKAMAVLLHLSYKSDVESTDVVQLSQVLESLYLTKDEPKKRGLINKIPLVLGKIPENGKHWINDFYKLRSDIAHGDFPLFRPFYQESDEDLNVVESHYCKITQAVDMGTSVVLATLQDLILKDANFYKFKVTLSVEACIND